MAILDRVFACVFRRDTQVASRFNMDDCDELIPLWFGRDVVDSEASTSEHLSGFIATHRRWLVGFPQPRDGLL